MEWLSKSFFEWGSSVLRNIDNFRRKMCISDAQFFNK